MMQALATYAMRGRREAILLAVVLIALPFLYWFGVAVVLLVALRRGAGDALGVLFWAMLPAIGWLAATGNSGPLLALTGGMLLAVVLRDIQSWPVVLLLATLLGAGGVLLIRELQPDLFARSLELLGEVFAKLGAGAPQEAGPAGSERYQQVLESLLMGGWGMWLSLSLLSCLAIARWWQAMLYRPGGFQSEFWSLRLPPPLSLLLVGLMVAGSTLSAGMVGWVPLLALPLLLAGVGLVHGMAGKFGLGSGWLVAFYGTLLLLSQFMILILVMFAFLDSFLDFRSRAGKLPPGNGPDESAE